MLQQHNIAVMGNSELGRIHIKLLQRLPHVRIKPIDGDLPEEADAFVIAEKTANAMLFLQAIAKTGKPVIFLQPELNSAELDKLNPTIKLQPGFKRRFDPHFLHVKEKITLGVLGQAHVVKMTNRYQQKNSPHHPVITLHDVDMARFITGQEVKEVFAMQSQLNEVETVVATLKMENNMLVTINASCQDEYDQRLEVFGEQGALVVDNVCKTTTHYFSAAGVLSEKPFANSLERYQQAFNLQLEAFLNCVTQPEKEMAAGLKELSAAVRLSEAIQQSIYS